MMKRMAAIMKAAALFSRSQVSFLRSGFAIAKILDGATSARVALNQKGPFLILYGTTHNEG
jgi:hypothetical protein